MHRRGRRGEGPGFGRRLCGSWWWGPAACGVTAAILLAAPSTGYGAAGQPPTREPASPEVVVPDVLKTASEVVVLGRLAREPMLAELSTGELFLAGYGAQSATSSHPDQAPFLWRSDDRGATWEVVDVGGPETGARGNSDVDLAVGPEDELYFASMGFDRTTLRGTHVAVGVSLDRGRSWRWSELSRTELDDRPWVVVTPDRVAHAVWNDGSGVAYARSEDRGASWQERPRIHDQGGSSHFAAGPAGELAVRISPLSASGHRFHEGADHIAVSTDGGASWTLHAPPSRAEWPRNFFGLAATPRWVEPLAWTPDGQLLHLWGEDGSLHLAGSVDRGASWTTTVLTGAEAAAPFFPYLVAWGERAAFSWWSGQGESLRAHIAVAQRGDGGWQIAARSEALEVDAWRAPPGADASSAMRETGGEYLPLLPLRGGGLAAAYTVQNAPRDRFGFVFRRFDLPK
ncbi:MAG: exo-alpha-sialidase [Acidobacteria bacterium]|nr:MAG: exo-alpha-sialidase [Acidobacteriota bacterium]REK07370.1 MAG: exo-alpha-sialidase [Acidobacteriota bacterium]